MRKTLIIAISLVCGFIGLHDLAILLNNDSFIPGKAVSGFSMLEMSTGSADT